MNAFLHALMEQRRKFLDGLDANEDDINLDIFEDFYPDQAHFVFELLQNAEDTGATEAMFTLTKEGCWFEHNGRRAFTESDVRAITGIHNSTKTKSSDQIGKFGVGFKSVFVYTQSPTIYSADFCFRILKFVMPEPVISDPTLGHRTKFWLPFNNPKKAPQSAFNEIRAGLQELAETALLFLPNIESIKWQVGGELPGEILRVEHNKFHIEVMKQVNGQTTTSSHFLKFDEPVTGLDKRRVAIAYALDFLPNVSVCSAGKALSQQLKIVPVAGQVAVYFPAGKETSGLRFHLHAPFVPELSRASIKETPANAPLFKQLASLTASSLHKIRDLGLLSSDFLGVLPNPQDQLGKPYTLIREAIYEAMNTEPLTPTHTKGHAPATMLVQAKSSLKELLNHDDIEILIDYDDVPPQWAASRALQGTNVERFMNGLKIRDWDIEAFVECVTKKTWSSTNADFMKWLAEKSPEWHQQFYALLAKESESLSKMYLLKFCKIVRLSDGAYGLGAECHFSDDRDLMDLGLHCVDPAVYTAGKSKSQQENARTFLELLGVTPVGERQFVEAILKSSYISEKRALNEREYLAHLRRFIKLLDEEPSCASLLSTFSLLFGKDNKWHKPAEIYLDWPYLDTGLGSYVDVLGTSVRLVPLADLYQHLPIDVSKVARFAERIGALSSIPLAIVPCSRNPEWRYLRGVPGERYTNPIDRDYAISRFDLLVGKKSEKLAKLVWNTMCSLAKNHDDEPTYRHNPLRAVYRKNERGGAHFADSNLVHQLRNEAWVPQRGGRFVQPTNARPELLPEGFTFDPGWPWIKAIQFGVSLHSLNAKAVADSSAAVERHRMQQEAAKTLGFDDAETARRAAKIPADEFNRFYADWERRKAIELPEHNPANPGRRTDRVSALAATAPERKTEERTRSVSVGREEVKAETDQYLRQQYTNGDADQICQICKDVLPFKLDNGTYYFEAVELLPDLQRRHVQNYLCLCPNHSAMFRHANGSRETLKKRIMQHSENEICMVLAQNDHVIYFTKTHLEDLKAIIKIDEKLFL